MDVSGQKWCCGVWVPVRVLHLSVATPLQPPLTGRLMIWGDQRNNLLFEVTRPMASDWLLIERLHVAKSSKAKGYIFMGEKYRIYHIPHHGTHIIKIL